MKGKDLVKRICLWRCSKVEKPNALLCSIPVDVAIFLAYIVRCCNDRELFVLLVLWILWQLRISPRPLGPIDRLDVFLVSR